jgi:hypothetical protein
VHRAVTRTRLKARGELETGIGILKNHIALGRISGLLQVRRRISSLTTPESSHRGRA